MDNTRIKKNTDLKILLAKMCGKTMANVGRQQEDFFVAEY